MENLIWLTYTYSKENVMAKFTCSRDAQWSILGFNIYIHICLPMGLIAYNLNEKQWAISLTYFIYI